MTLENNAFVRKFTTFSRWRTYAMTKFQISTFHMPNVIKIGWGDKKKLQIFIRVPNLQKSLMADEYRIFSVILTSNSQHLATKA